MDAEISEKFASSLAVYAVHGDRTELEKCALGEGLAASLQNVGNQAGTALQDVYSKAQPYLADPRIRNALLGAGAGGLVGMLQPKRKMRNALTYGLLGGLSGAGLTHAFSGGAGAPAAKNAPAASRGASTPPAAGQANNPTQANNAAPPAPPDGREQAKKELYSTGLDPVTGGQIGATGGGIAAALGVGKAVNTAVTQRAVNKDWEANSTKYLYDLANPPPGGPPVTGGPDVSLTGTARDLVRGTGNIGKGGRPSADYQAPSVTLGADGNYVIANADRLNKAKALMARATKPNAQQRLRGRVAGGLAGPAAGIITALGGRALGEAGWNLMNRWNHPAAFEGSTP